MTPDYRVFAYLNADKAQLYQAILTIFMDAKTRFALHLRPAEIRLALPADAAVEMNLVESALRQLCEWGNLEAHSDTSEVATVEEFYRPRFLYQLTPTGQAAEESLRLFRQRSSEPGALKTVALGDLQELLTELTLLIKESPIDEAKAHRTLVAMVDRFEDLTSHAQRFIASLQRAMDLQGAELGAFLEYKRFLIDYLERFIGELTLATGQIAGKLEEIQGETLEILLSLAARRELQDVLNLTASQQQETLLQWRLRWKGFQGWFISSPGRACEAEILRSLARSAIPTLLLAIAGLHDRRTTRSDRVTDFRTLGRWFYLCEDDPQAHRLWRAAFGLYPARHWKTDANLLERQDQEPVPAQTSWLSSPALECSPRLRKLGPQTRISRVGQVEDLSVQRRELARFAAEEARQIAAAQQRLAGLGQLRLSEIGHLEPAEFHLFLDLLGQALAAKLHPMDTVQESSSDGALEIRLEPLDDGTQACIETSEGCFRGPDHRVLIRESWKGESLP